MHNVTYRVEGKKLIIEIDLTVRKDVGNEKTVRVASTLGNKVVADFPNEAVFLGLNAYVYRHPKE